MEPASPPHPPDQIGQSEQIIDEHVGLIGADQPLDARLYEVGPLGGNRPHGAIRIDTHHTPTRDVGVLADTLELLARTWVKRVNDTYKVLSRDRSTCILE